MFGATAGHSPMGSPMGSPDVDWDEFPGSPGGSRRPAVRGRITGNIVEWKGKFGWIAPDMPIDHPEARMKGGKIYLSQEDVAEVISGVGAHVSFYVYADGTGLGAMMCVPSDSTTTSAPLKKKAKATPKPTPKAKATPGRKRVQEGPMHGKVKSWRGGFGFITPTSPVEHPLFTGSVFLSGQDVADPEAVAIGKSVSFYLYADPQGLGAEECTVVDGDAADALPKTGATSAAETSESSSSTLLKAKPKAAAGGPLDGIMQTIMTPRAKGAPMKATPKAAPGLRGDPELQRKMNDFPELAKRLSAWMFDPGG